MNSCLISLDEGGLSDLLNYKGTDETAVLMITTPTCSKCRDIKRRINEFGFPQSFPVSSIFVYEFDGANPNALDLIISLGVRMAPTFVGINRDKRERKVIEGIETYDDLTTTKPLIP